MVAATVRFVSQLGHEIAAPIRGRLPWRDRRLRVRRWRRGLRSQSICSRPRAWSRHRRNDRHRRTRFRAASVATPDLVALRATMIACSVSATSGMYRQPDRRLGPHGRRRLAPPGRHDVARQGPSDGCVKFFSL